MPTWCLQSFQEILAVFLERQFKLALKENQSYTSAGSDDEDESETDINMLDIKTLPCAELGVLLRELRWTGVVEETVSCMLYGQVMAARLP